MLMSKIILITGASSGMGKETALLLLQEGHTVYGAARSVDDMKALEDHGGHALKMDITKDDQIVAGVEEVIKKEGCIDVLVNNAGFGLYGAVEDIPLDDARYQFEVNVFGLGRLTQLVLPHMRNQGSGTIINISSMGGKMYTPLGAWYHATKHAIEGWSDCLRLELKQFNIDVVIVEPGLIDTGFADVMAGPMEKYSSTGPYKEFVQKIAAVSRRAYGKEGRQSPPSVIANVISKAIAAKKPKTRYVAGSLAKPLIFLRKWFGDRFFDWAVMTQIR